MLTNRNIKFEDITHYLETTDEDILNPNLIANIKNGVQMLMEHISAGDKILV